MMGEEQNLRELSLNEISFLTICEKREIHEWKFSSFFRILCAKLVNFSMISREMPEITWIGQKLEFTT